MGLFWVDLISFLGGEGGDCVHVVDGGWMKGFEDGIVVCVLKYVCGMYVQVLECTIQYRTAKLNTRDYRASSSGNQRTGPYAGFVRRMAIT